MAQAQARINIDIKEIYAKLCPKCKEAIKALIKDKISDIMVSSITGETPQKGGEKKRSA